MTPHGSTPAPGTARAGVPHGYLITPVTDPLKLRTQPQVEAMLLQIHMKPRQARIGSAIAMCEAPYAPTDDGVARCDFGLLGDIELENDVYGPSVGGFQIRSLKADTGTGSWRDVDELVHPLFNCRAAREIRRDSGWGAWTTFSNGQYEVYLPDLFPVPPGIHAVVYGESLTSIAAEESDGTWTWEDLARVNNVRGPDYVIQIGQWLTLP